MDVDNIEKITLVTSGTGRGMKPESVYIFRKNNGVPTKEAYSAAEHSKLIAEFANANGKSVEDLQKEGLLNGVHFEDVDKLDELNKEFDNAFRGVSDDNSDEIDPIKKTSSKGKTVAKVVGATAALAGAIGGIAVGCSKIADKEDDKETNIDFDTASFDELMNILSESSYERKFSQNVYDVMEKLNTRMKSEGIFKLDIDKDNVLQFTVDEIIAAKLALNDFTDDQLKEIFGLYNLDSDVVLSNYESFTSKMKVFAMNGKSSSSVSELIENEENRRWFELVESSITTFNSNLTNENSDKVIKTFAYFYTHGINGVDNIENNMATLNCIKNLALNMVVGYSDANANTDYKKYLTVSSQPGEFDSKYVTNKMSQVQKGEQLSKYIDITENGVCTISVVSDHLKDIDSRLSEMRRSTINIAKQELDSVLCNEGYSNLSVLYGTLDEEAIRNTKNKKCIEALDRYISITTEKYIQNPTFEQISKAIVRDLGPYKEISNKTLYTTEELKDYLITLVNNRHRGSELLNSKRGSGTDISREEFNSMNKNEQKNYIKNNGTVTGTKTETKTEEVKKDDLTPSERKDAEDQEKEQEKIFVNDGKEYKADAAKAAKQGQLDANDYCLSTKLGDRVIIAHRNGQNVSYNTYINESASAMNKSLSSYNYKDSKEVEAYKAAWNSEIKDRVDYALEVAKEEDRIKEKAQREIDELNKNQNSKPSDSNNNNNSTPDVVEKPNGNDELDDPNINQEPAPSEGEIIHDEDVDVIEPTFEDVPIDYVPNSMDAYQTFITEPDYSAYAQAAIDGLDEALATYQKTKTR